MTIIEKILASHSGKDKVVPGEIVDVAIDVRLARDFGGAGVVRNLQINNLGIADPGKTFFTFDCNPTGSDQQYAANQQKCRLYARQNNIMVYDINAGIGTHIAIDDGLAAPGSTLVSTDSHANILGAIGAFGQGMGRFALGNLKNWEDYPQKSEPGDIIITGKNFGAGSSRQHAVDCFRALDNQAILAESFGAIYERNAINAGFPVLTYRDLGVLQLENRDIVILDLEKGTLTNKKNKKSVQVGKFSEVQRMIYERGDLLRI